MVEMLDDTFRGILRDIMYAVRTNPDRRNVDQTIAEAIHMTEKPYELTDLEWDTFVRSICNDVSESARMDPSVSLETIVRDVFDHTMRMIFD